MKSDLVMVNVGDFFSVYLIRLSTCSLLFINHPQGNKKSKNKKN